MTRINANAFLAWLISLGITTVVLIGCGSPTAPQPTPAPNSLSPTATPLRNTAVPNVTQPALNQNPLPDLPLKLGATWVYSNVVYSGANPQNVLTSTYVYTDVIIETRSVPPYFAAEVSRTVSLMAGEPLFNAPEAETGWYVISGTQVYKQPGNALDFSNASSSWLEYVFPLSKRDWYPDPEQRNNLPPDSMFSGKRYTYPKGEVSVPAGQFNNCFSITTAYLNGPMYRWFCPYLGVVAEKYDHPGTPFGYDAVLMSYSLQTSP